MPRTCAVGYRVGTISIRQGRDLFFTGILLRKTGIQNPNKETFLKGHGDHIPRFHTDSKRGTSLLDACPCLLDFISAVVSNTSSDPGVLSFTLKLTGLTGATEHGFNMLQERSFLSAVFSIRRWQEAGSWKDPRLRIGWVQGLKNLLQHPKALSFFVQSDFVEPLLQLQTDPSLFVASAVNQTLAHILLFFQPVSSPGVNESDDGRTLTSVHSDVVAVISEHLRDSLVPGGSTQLQQSLQTLRLLAPLLGQAGPPLRRRLLQTVADSLEELVAAGYSRLTLPLMDVLLAAHSCSTDDQPPVSRLLSSMLNTDDPADLVRAAAACLHGGPRDTAHTTRAARTLLLPLEIITGQTLLAADTDADEHRVSMGEHLKRKACCISVTCVCLTSLPRITFTVKTPSDFLPCPPGSIVAALLSLLKICRGVSWSGGCSEVCRNIIGSVKVQKCALEALRAVDSSAGGGEEEIGDVLTVLIQCLDSPDSDPTVIHKSYQAFVKWTSVLTDASFVTDQLRLDLVRVVRKRVCDVRWEVRDSTLEFLGHLADVSVSPKSAEETRNASDALLGGCCTTSLMGEAMQDTESYVRASAIAALARTLSRDWQQGAALGQRETEIAGRLLDILSQDTEGFSRRAVVRYFVAWFSSRPSHPSSASFLRQCVHTVLSLGGADLDWEVRVHTLELAELLLDEAVPGRRGHAEGVASDAAGAMSSLVERGVVSALLSGLVDCNRPVALKACRLLMRLRDAVRPSWRGPPDAAGVSCELPAGGWGREIRKILGTKRSCGAGEEDLAAQGRSNGADRSEDALREGGDGGTVGVQEVLRSLDLDQRLDVLTRSSDHICNSPLSLLQDILAASVAHTGGDTRPGPEVIVDCY